MTFLPYFVFIMYAINRGTNFTQALFMNCDHSLLTYSFYKQPKFVLKLFQIRLREIIKINLLPAAMIGVGLAVLLYASGGTDNPLNYGILIISILCMSMFFSVHYLTIYYLLQPYNISTEIKSGTYQLVLSATYLVCFFMMRWKMPIFLFGLMAIAFCVVYCVIACILIYRFAPKTFRLRTQVLFGIILIKNCFIFSINKNPSYIRGLVMRDAFKSSYAASYIHLEAFHIDFETCWHNNLND